MELKPIKCLKLEKSYQFKSLETLRLKVKQALRDLDQEKQAVDPSVFELLKFQEAFDALQKEGKNKSLVSLVYNPSKSSKFENYLQALDFVSKQKSLKISEGLLCKLHRMVQGHLGKDHEALGKYRKKQNWIGPEGCKIHDAYFLPPESSQVNRLMKDLYIYVKTSKDDPLIKIGIWFSRLLVIHPFMDGNGRLARLFISLFLKEMNLQKDLNFFGSYYFKKNRLKYFETLYEITESNKLIPWMRFFLNSLVFSAKREIKLLKLLTKEFQKISKILGKKRTTKLFSSGVLESKEFNADILKELKRQKLIKTNGSSKAWIELCVLSKLN